MGSSGLAEEGGKQRKGEGPPLTVALVPHQSPTAYTVCVCVVFVLRVRAWVRDRVPASIYLQVSVRVNKIVS